MFNERKYVISSIELHLFFLRIMKEHAIFLEIAFTPKNLKLAKEADNYKIQFEKNLSETLRLSRGMIRESFLESGEMVTNYTLDAEKKTEYYTGIMINQRITGEESKLECGSNPHIRNQTIRNIKQLNRNIYRLLDEFLDFKGKILNEVLDFNIFTTNYPSLIKHIIHEANEYKASIIEIEDDSDMDYEDIKENEVFWDEIMMEHAETIRGLLDPSEKELFKITNIFAENFDYLFKNVKDVTGINLLGITNENLNETLKFKEFKETGTKGILDGKIESIILPLLADHVLREANHFIRILKNYRKKLNKNNL
ncbi:DUF2935 domain-containing protein [Clostridium sp. SHJSY1]|uniref:DUF2935 domain-containing protein n=1 Tax=Clostridium sp. SHJSY1 TaxID=2942483 RepID=UPI0028742049|nr:DUF2935 domain-containing protein [Clostridium sp. SHJSY1]MDS0527373.1 DUF2935 domain-containing protein [Clostridium sp. SHJSY1]